MKGTVEGNSFQHLKNILIINYKRKKKNKFIIFKEKVKQMFCSLIIIVGQYIAINL